MSWIFGFAAFVATGVFVLIYLGKLPNIEIRLNIFEGTVTISSGSTRTPEQADGGEPNPLEGGLPSQ